MHVVLSGYYGFNNVGDEAILLSIIRALRAVDKDIQITVLSNQPALTAEEYQVQAVNRWKFSDIKETLKNADGLISGGGSLFQDETSVRSVIYYGMVVRIAQKLKKPVFIYAQGIGPLNNALSKWIVRRRFNRTDGITVRDGSSRDLLKSLRVKKDISVVPDPVLGMEPVNLGSAPDLGPFFLLGPGKDGISPPWKDADSVSKSNESSLQHSSAFDTDTSGDGETHQDSIADDAEWDSEMNEKQEKELFNVQQFEDFSVGTPREGFITVSVRKWETEATYKSKLAQGLDLLAADGTDIVFVPMHGEEDAEVSREVAGLMNQNKFISPSDATIEEKMAIIGASKLLIGMRLHALVFASVHTTPFVALSYDPKVEAFADLCSQPVAGHVEKDDWNGEKVYSLASESLKTAEATSEKLGELISKYKQQAKATAKIAVDTFSQTK